MTGNVAASKHQTICPLAACFAISSDDLTSSRNGKSEEEGKRNTEYCKLMKCLVIAERGPEPMLLSLWRASRVAPHDRVTLGAAIRTFCHTIMKVVNQMPEMFAFAHPGSGDAAM